MRKIKSYKEHINESIDITDHIIDVDQAEEILANIEDEKIKEIAPNNIREWNTFSDQLNLINSLADDIQNQKLVIDDEMKELANAGTSEYSSDLNCKNYVLKKLGHDYKHSIFELIDGYYGLQQSTQEALQSIGFYKTHLSGELSIINKKFEDLTKLLRVKQLTEESLDSYIDTAKKAYELYKRFCKNGETHNFIGDNVFDLVRKIEPELVPDGAKWYNNAVVRFFYAAAISSSEKDVLPMLDLAVRKRGISPAMLAEYMSKLSSTIRKIATENKENKRIAGFEDFFRVKPDKDQKSVMRAPEMKAFLKSGKTKLYIDALDAKWGVDFPQFPSEVADKITEINFTVNNNTGPNIVNIFALKKSEHPIKVSGTYNIEPVAGETWVWEEINGEKQPVKKYSLKSKAIPFINAGKCNITPGKFDIEWTEKSLVGNSGKFVVDYQSYRSNEKLIRDVFKLLKDKVNYVDKEQEDKAIQYVEEREAANKKADEEREQRRLEREQQNNG